MAFERSPIPRLAFDVLKEAESSYKTNQTLTEETWQLLNSVFGYSLIKAAEILDQPNSVVRYITRCGLRAVFKVANTKECFYVREHVNWCKCDTFEQLVLKSRNAVTCKHVLAVRLAKIMNKFNSETITDEKLIELLKYYQEEDSN